MGQWRTLTSRTAYENPWIFVREDTATNPAGKEVVYGVVESKSDSVYIVPIDEDGNTYIVRQFRYALQREEWECVAGRNDGELFETAAKRELLEETGVQAETIIKIGDVQTASGVTTFHSAFCIARGLTKITEQLDGTDGILEAKKLPLDEVINMIMSGEIVCTGTIAAFMMAREYLAREGKNEF